MCRWLLISLTTAAFGFGLTASAQQPVPVGPPQSVPVPTVATLTDEGEVHIAHAGCSSCGPQTKLGQKVAAHFSKIHPEPTCWQCGTAACEWRFFLGGCRSYFGEGRFGPVLAPNP